MIAQPDLNLLWAHMSEGTFLDVVAQINSADTYMYKTVKSHTMVGDLNACSDVTCMRSCRRACVHARTHIHTYIHTYMHTYIHLDDLKAPYSSKIDIFYRRF